MSLEDNDCDWVCDACNASLNSQPGFNVLSGTWRCVKCGALNDVSPNNILNLLEMLRKGITEFTTKPLENSDTED